METWALFQTAADWPDGWDCCPSAGSEKSETAPRLGRGTWEGTLRGTWPQRQSCVVCHVTTR